MLRYLVVAGLSLGGCQGLPTDSDIARAAAIIDQTYANPDTPQIHAVRQSNCHDPFGNEGIQFLGRCIPGWTADNGCTFLLGPVLSDTQLAHEMHHWAIYIRRGGGDASMDPNHSDPTWTWEVDLANANLKKDGL